jgi:hypothetical protein
MCPLLQQRILPRNAEGKLVMEAVLETKAETVLQFIHGLRGSLHVTFDHFESFMRVLLPVGDDSNTQNLHQKGAPSYNALHFGGRTPTGSLSFLVRTGGGQAH